LDFSITITTCNRADSLRSGLDALALQTYPLEKVEIIVADNGSTDHTKDVADSFAGRFPNFRYIYDARPGQMVGWHRALPVAAGEVTCFIDDDVRPAPGWLSALAACYRDPRVGLATGPIRLAYDADPPDWIASMILGEPGRQTLPFLGGLDCGPSPRDIPGNFVWGTNFSVRRSVLVEVGGFHPCAMPWDLIRFYADGEIHVGRTAEQRGHLIVYHPQAAVEHHIPTARLTLDAVTRKFTTTGCARSYQTLRASGQTYPAPSADEIRAIARRYFRDPDTAPPALVEAVEIGLDQGMSQHRAAFINDPFFRDWVMRNNYLDLDAAYVHPDLSSRGDAKASDWRSGT